ncbi:hypothetical protein L1987_54127 [Smallanthus sonchifolius]|uniref:Uncharacterized protein n=1 Tax=Smallanthus sonchifolius TaxID=185202 RepID=A0ACB9E6N0_9ASTR|nr:hypothetical protein L1987_54127 [Smallanthus sonchifolius]
MYCFLIKLEASYSRYQMDNMLKLGPTGMKGQIWDEKSSSELVEIQISHVQDYIKSIQFTYRTGMKVCHSQTYGESSGLINFDMVISIIFFMWGHANLLCIVPILSDVPEGTTPLVSVGD